MASPHRRSVSFDRAQRSSKVYVRVRQSSILSTCVSNSKHRPLIYVLTYNSSRLQCCEDFLNNKRCFLDDPSWTKLLEAITAPHETFTDRSVLGTTLMILMATLPGLTKRTDHALVMQDTLQPEDFIAIAAEVRLVRSAIVTWRRKFNIALLHVEERSRDDTADFGKRYELLGISLIINIMVSRMLCCVVPSERALLEEEVQNLSFELKGVRESVEHNLRATFFLAQKATIADAAIATHSDFQDVVGSGKIVESWRLKRFCEAFGRRCCDGVTCCEQVT
jgi:hypothetical protein